MKKMQMRLMSGVATVLFPLFSSHAQVCTPTPDCATMGYNKTEEQCVGLSVVRCPYDINKLFCTDGQTGGDGCFLCNEFPQGYISSGFAGRRPERV